MTTPLLRNSTKPSLAQHRLFLIAFALAWFALSPIPNALGVSPAPDGGYAGNNTAEGQDALFSLTTGVMNTAVGFDALYFDTTGSFNTATGFGSLFRNTTGGYNTANGYRALFNNTIGVENTANGYQALFHNTTGSNNTANGSTALLFNYTGIDNTANGFQALYSNTTGNGNTANGRAALSVNRFGSNNTANGYQALFGTTGSFNIGLGFNAGVNLTTGNDNIDIGNQGVAGEAKTIRIGIEGTHTSTFIAGISGVTVAGGVGVIIDTNGHLGTVVSSERFKEAIKPMDKASEVILALKPVTFRYKHELDPDGIPQFGLVAEQVEKVNPALVARDADGKVWTVRYEAVNAMLLNEFLKEHHQVQEQGATITELNSRLAEQEVIIAQQQKGMEAVAARLKEQDSKIQEVSDQLELSKSAPRTVAGNQ